MIRSRKIVVVTVFFVVGAMATAFTDFMSAQDAALNPAQQQATVYEGRTPGLKPPRAVYSPSPEYSEKARKKKIQGTVILSLVVTKDGTVREAQVTKSLEPTLDKQALLGVQQWKFEPATKDGEPVDMRVPVEVSFRLY